MYQKLTCCKYCSLDFKNFNSSERANHSRWCDENPKIHDYKNFLASTREKITLESRKKQKESLSNAHANGVYNYSDIAKKSLETKKLNNSLLHKEETKKIIKEKALLSSHRRLRRKLIEYNGIWLDSSWELELAKRLDDLKINWIRPNPVIWFDEQGNSHHYFPDFYLPEYNLFLDPKNPHAIKVQKKKLDMLLQQYKNIRIIDTLDKCKNFII